MLCPGSGQVGHLASLSKLAGRRSSCMGKGIVGVGNLQFSLFCRIMNCFSFICEMFAVLCMAGLISGQGAASAGIGDVDMGTVEAFMRTKEFRVS